MMYNIRIFSERIMWNNTTSCGLCNFPKLIQCPWMVDLRRASVDKASRCFRQSFSHLYSSKSISRRKPRFQPTDTKASKVQDLRRAYRLRY